MNRAETLYFNTEHLKHGIGGAAVRGGATVMGSQIAVQAIRFACGLALARLLDPVDFGLLAMVLGITAALLIFKDLGLCDAVIQWPSINHRQVSVLFWVNFAVSALACLGVVVAAPFIARFYHEPRLTAIAMVWSLALLVGGTSAQHLALLKRGMFFHAVSILTIAAAVVSNGTALLMAWRGYGYWALVWREVLAEVMLGLGAWVICSWRPGLPTRGNGARPILAFGGHTIVSFVIKRFTNDLDKTLIGWRFGAGPVGAYSRAIDLAMMPASNVAVALRSVAVASLAKLRDDPVTYRRYFLKSIRTLALLCFPATAFLVAVSDDFIAIALGPKWKSAARLFGVLGLGAGLSVIYMTHVWLHFSLGRADRLARWSSIGAVVTVTAFFAGLPFGPIGVAWAQTLVTLILTLWGLWYAGRPIELRLMALVGAMWRPGAAGGIAALAAWWLVVRPELTSGHLTRIMAAGVAFAPLCLMLIVLFSGGWEPLRELAGAAAKLFQRGNRTKPILQETKPAFSK